MVEMWNRKPYWLMAALATLGALCQGSGRASKIMASEIPTLAAIRAISFGNPDTLDGNPQRRTAVVTAVLLSSDASWLAAAGDDHKIRLFDIESGRLIRELTGHRDWIRGLTISQDGQNILSAGADGRCRCWQTKDGHLVKLDHRHTGPLRCVAFHPNGNTYAAAGFCCAPCIHCLTSTAESKVLHDTRRDHTAITFSPDGKRLAITTADGKLRIWDVATAELMQEIAADSRRLRTVAFSPNGETVATGGDGQEVALWNVATGEKVQQLSTRPAKVYSLKFLSESELAVAGTDNRIQIWRIAGASLVRLLEGHTGTVTSLAVDSARGLLVSGSFDTTVRVWQLEPKAVNKTARRAVDASR